MEENEGKIMQSRLIDAFELADYANNTKDKTVDVNDIMRFPTVDAVPVVRCKYCKWFNPEIEFGEIRIGTCPYQPPYEHTHGEGYCFRGIRKESEKQ